MKVLLLNPPRDISDVYGGMAKIMSNVPPQGLCQIASFVRAKHPEVDVRILDSQALNIGVQSTIEEILRFAPDILGISLYTSKIYLSSMLVSELVKKTDKKMLIVAGGPHSTFYGANFLKEQPEFDLAVMGEGEETFCEIIESLSSGLSMENIKGLIIRKGDEIIRAERRRPIPDLDMLPLPAWDLLPELKKYYRLSGFKVKRDAAGMSIITSRGCPGKCNFCNPRGLGPGLRHHSPDYIIKLIKELYHSYGIREFYIQDDMFTADREHVSRFCDMLISSGLNIPWTCNLRVDYIDLDILKKMKKAGCWQVGFGIESGAQEILDVINKGTTVEQNLEATLLCKKAGIEVMGLFMVGIFKETRETLRKTLEFIDRAYLTDLQVTFYTPLPGTASWVQWPKYGQFDEKHGAFHVRPSFVATGFTAEELISYQKKMYMKFYLKPRILLRYLKALFNPRLSSRLLQNIVGFLSYLFYSKKNEQSNPGEKESRKDCTY